MNPTPIYTEALREAKRRTRKGSPERAVLVEMDERTAPKGRASTASISGRATGPTIHFGPPFGPPADLGAELDYYARARRVFGSAARR